MIHVRLRVVPYFPWCFMFAFANLPMQELVASLISSRKGFGEWMTHGLKWENLTARYKLASDYSHFLKTIMTMLYIHY